jgi:phage terminase large subunit-like protein
VERVKLKPRPMSGERSYLTSRNWTSSLAEALASMATESRERILSQLSEDDAASLANDFRFWARDKQLPPAGDWSVWVVRAGRGWGKTRCGAHWVHERAMENPGRWIALVAKTPADARDVAIEGPSGILRNAPPNERPNYEPSKRRLSWPNSSWATIYSDEEPDQTRGFSGDTAWLDEFAKFVNPEETWTNLSFGMRETSNDKPRRLITTTPRPIPILMQIEAMETTVVTTGSSYENKDNLDPAWFRDVLAHYSGTRIGRQEIEAEILEDVPGALWTRAILDAAQFNCGPIDEIRIGGAALPGQELSTVGVWTG